PAFYFIFLFVTILLFLVSDGTWEYDHFIHQDSLLVAELGSSVIIPCSHSDDYINTVLWYKHSVGKKPLLIAYSEHGSGSVTYQNGFNNTNRYFIRSEPDSFNLTIVHLEEYDFVTYYCAVSFLNMITFGEGTILLHKGEFMTISELHPQSDCTCILHSGDSVTLQCSVISQICAGEYRVYWFRHSSGHSDPGIIYTHDNRSDQCMERSESSSSIQSCVYSLSQTELTPSDAGIYYCAVATCGKIHLGNGTKLIIEDLVIWNSITLVLATLNIMTMIVIITLLIVIHKIHIRGMLVLLSLDCISTSF
uniref:Novel immune-type receptor 3b n=1 Tax=Cyprinus carpio TaxID=7962 RepID=A0A8C2HJ47_CYPCA